MELQVAGEIDVGSSVNGIYVPDVGETGWGTNVSNNQRRLADLAVNVKAYDAVGDGIANDTTAGNDAITTVSAAGGGTVYFPAGTYRGAFVLKPKVRLLGAGIGATTLKAVASSNSDVIKGLNFDTLTNKSKATGDILLGTYLDEIAELTIDGDKATQTSGYGIRVWGRSHYWHNIVVQNCKSDGIWTEFTSHDAATTNDVLESVYAGLKTVENDGSGWINRGPHDSYISHYVTASNGAWGYKGESTAGGYNGGPIYGDGWNAWANTLGGFYFNTSGGHITNIAGTTDTGTGIEIASGSGSLKFYNALVTGPTGIILRGSDHEFHGQVLNCSTVGIDLNSSVAQCLINAHGVNNEIAVKFTSEAGPNQVFGTFNVAAAKTLVSGTPSGTDTVLLSQNGAAGNNRYLVLPGNVMRIPGGYEWRMYAGSGSPEGSITASQGALFINNNANGTETALYVKDSGTGNTGWKNTQRHEVVVTASLPAAGAANDGRVIIEDAGAGVFNLITYHGGTRRRTTLGAAF